MTTVTIDIRNIASKTYPDDKVVFRSPEVRENPAGGLVSTAEETVHLVDGQGSINLTPGPVVVFIQCRGVADNRAKDGTVPETGTVALVDVLAGSFTYTPAAVSAAVQARNEAREAAAQALASKNAAATSASNAATSASTASSAASSATTSKNQAATSASNAANSASSASTSASNASASASAAAGSASSASTSASTATTAKNDAATSASSAATSATDASNAADRAEAGADRVGSAEQVGQWASQASNAASSADASKTAAATSASDAASSATSAANSASAADTSKTAAANSASSASTSATSADASKTAAAGSASTASTAATTATTAKNEAASSATAAAGSATTAGTAATTATNKAVEASNAADRAEAATEGKADLVGGKIPSSQIPDIAITKTHVVSSIGQMLALDAQQGDVAVLTLDLGDTQLLNTFILGEGDPTIGESWINISVDPSQSVITINGQSGYVTLGAADVGAAPTNHTHTLASLGAAASTHTHTSAQISDATSTATASRVVRRDTNGRFNVTTPTASAHPTPKSYVDSGLTNVYTEMYKRPALFSGAGNPPGSIPGAVVGDYWLNTTTMELRQITGV